MIGASISAGFLNHAEGRRAVISCDAFHMGIQNKHTPWPLTEQMVDSVAEAIEGNEPKEQPPAESILVLFNLEFLEVLSSRYPKEMSKVTFVADAPLEKTFAEVLYKVRALYLKEGSWTNKVAAGKVTEETWRRLMKMNGAADITLTNPPYNGGLDLKILLAMNEAKLLKKVVCVHPSTWLVDVKTQLGPKTGNPLFRKFQDMVSPHLKSVHLFNGNPVFGIGLFVPCVVTDMDMGWTRQQGTSIKVKDVGQDEYREVFGLDDITLHGKDWDPTVKEFMGRVQKFCEKNGSLQGNIVDSTQISSKHPVQIAAIRGHVHVDKMIDVDFYTLLMKDSEGNKGVRDASPQKSGNIRPSFDMHTVQQQDHLVKYLQTDFARLCLSLLKIKQHLFGGGEMQLVPWLDFTRSWDDDQLFSMLGYPRGHAIREYAKRFLPDYHNIYPNGKTY